MHLSRYDFFSDIFNTYSENVFILNDDKALTYQQFLDNSVRLLNYLVQQGVRHGDRVVIGLENREEYLELIFALAIGGMVACPVDPSISVDQLTKAKKVVDARLTITSYDQLAYSLDSSLPDCIRHGGLDDPFLVVFSSGTTGAPKGIVQSFGNFFKAAAAFSTALGQCESQVTLHNWPMFYNAGLFNLFACPLMSGGAIAVCNRFTAKSIAEFWESLERIGPDYIYISPTMAATLSKTYIFYKPNLAGLQRAIVVSTSSILYPSIRDEFKSKLGVSIRPCFGITELGGSFTIGSSDSKPFSVGEVMPGVTLRFSEEDGGELMVKSPYLALGYLQDSGNIEYFDRAAYFQTGDLGYFENKELFISGRKKDSIKKGGEQINLSEIEDLLQAADICEECHAVGKPDLFWGETYDVFFVTRAGGDAQVIHDEIVRLFNAKLPQNQRPDQVMEINVIPRTASGKVIKHLISYKVI